MSVREREQGLLYFYTKPSIIEFFLSFFLQFHYFLFQYHYFLFQYHYCLFQYHYLNEFTSLASSCKKKSTGKISGQSSAAAFYYKDHPCFNEPSANQRTYLQNYSICWHWTSEIKMLQILIKFSLYSIRPI